MPFRQPPPAILSLDHEGKLGPGCIWEFVQEFDLQPGADQRVQDFAQIVVPDVISACLALGFGAGRI